MSKRNNKNSAKMSLSLSRSVVQLYCTMMNTLLLTSKTLRVFILAVDKNFYLFRFWQFFNIFIL